MGEQFYIIAALAVVTLYPIAHSILIRATEGTRMEFADLGKQLLASPEISESHKEFISDMLDDVFSWQFMARATFMFPYLAFTGTFKHGLDSADKAFVNREDVSEFFRLHQRAVMAASPMWSALFVVVAALTVLLFVAWIGCSLIAYLWADTVKHVSPSVHNSRTTHGKPLVG